MKHGRACPMMCSQCQPGVAVQRVTVIDHTLCIDGKPTGRPMDHEREITARRTARFRRRA